MCAIFGQISTEQVTASHLAAQARLLHHRGPDGIGLALFSSPNVEPSLFSDHAELGQRPFATVSGESALVALGHRRLSIVELSTLGHQPMSSNEGNLWIVFNGEIYNHVELRTELQALGHRFKSHSDTEVILAAYLEWGKDCLARFNGMWAFCIYNRRTGEVFFARDRFGVKPLYFWRDGKTLFFASEIKAFLALPTFSVVPNRDRMADYLVHGPSEWARDTVFEGVTRLDAGSFIAGSAAVLARQEVPQVRWWRLEPNSSKELTTPARERVFAEEYYSILDEAVRLRLRADVPVGSALSGGLDSSSIVYLVAEQLKASGQAVFQHSFSSVYQSREAQSCDESNFIDIVAAQCGVERHVIEPRPEDVPDFHKQMIWHMDTPPESTLMSSWHTFKLVNSTGIRVTLDGQGADEQLGGYLFYLPHSLYGRGSIDSLKEAAAIYKQHGAKLAMGSMLIKIAAASRLSGLPHAQTQRHLKMAQALPLGLNNVLASDCGRGLSNLIHYADRTSMAFSVESRMPFLDFRLAEFLAGLPEAYKLQRGWTKLVARQAFDGRLDNAIVWRTDKMGWPIPEQYWANGPLRRWFNRPDAARHKFMDIGIGSQYASSLSSSNITRKIRALNLNSWYETFAERGWRQYV